MNGISLKVKLNNLFIHDDESRESNIKVSNYFDEIREVVRISNKLYGYEVSKPLKDYYMNLLKEK